VLPTGRNELEDDDDVDDFVLRSRSALLAAATDTPITVATSTNVATTANETMRFRAELLLLLWLLSLFMVCGFFFSILWECLFSLWKFCVQHWSMVGCKS
jgi:hypothetical protein